VRVPDISSPLIYKLFFFRSLDLFRAYFAISAPRYAAFSVIRSIRPLAVNCPPRIHEWGSEYALDKCGKKIYRYCEEFMVLIHGLEDLMLLIRSVADNARIPDSSDQDLVACSVLQLLKPSEYDRPDNPIFLAKKCVCLALLIFIDFAVQYLFDYPNQDPSILAGKLKATFLPGNAHTPGARSLEMLAVMMLQSNRMTMEKPWRCWYVADVGILTMRQSDSSWRRVEAELLDYIRQEKYLVGMRARSSALWDMGNIATIIVEAWS
jgi:hypothetical protein